MLFLYLLNYSGLLLDEQGKSWTAQQCSKVQETQNWWLNGKSFQFNWHFNWAKTEPLLEAQEKQNCCEMLSSLLTQGDLVRHERSIYIWEGLKQRNQRDSKSMKRRLDQVVEPKYTKIQRDLVCKDKSSYRMNWKIHSRMIWLTTSL